MKVTFRPQVSIRGALMNERRDEVVMWSRPLATDTWLKPCVVTAVSLVRVRVIMRSGTALAGSTWWSSRPSAPFLLVLCGRRCFGLNVFRRGGSHEELHGACEEVDVRRGFRLGTPHRWCRHNSGR